MPHQLVLLRRIRGDDEQVSLRGPDEFLQLAQHGVEHFLALDRLGDERMRAGIERLVAGFVGGNDRDGNVPRRRIVLQPMQDPPAVDIGQEQIERDGGRLELVGKLQRRDALRCDDSLEALFARRVEQESRKREIVLDDEQDVVARLDRVPVVAHLVDQPGQALQRVGGFRHPDGGFAAVGGAIHGAASVGVDFLHGQIGRRRRLADPTGWGAGRSMRAARAVRKAT